MAEVSKRFEGTDEKVGAEMNVIKDVTFEGTILNQVKKTVEYLETQVREHTFLGQHGKFVTRRDYPKFVIQEMTVNSVCHRAYNIKGTEIQIKMFDDRLVFESPGKLPGQAKPSNIRNTHFSRNPKIAAFLKVYHYVKEFGEGMDRVCREQEANGAQAPSFRTDDFILKITVPKVTENSSVRLVTEQKRTEKLPENTQGLTEKLPENVIDNVTGSITDTSQKTSQKTPQKTPQKIIDLVRENPYITTSKMADIIGIDRRNVARNIRKLQVQGVVRRVGPDKGGFWEIIKESQ